MNKITKLQDFKNIKRAALVVDDINTILKCIDLSTKAFNHYKKYTSCQEILNVLKSNKKMLEIHLNKYKKLLEK